MSNLPSVHEFINSCVAILAFGALMVLLVSCWLAAVEYRGIKNRRHWALLLGSSLVFLIGSLYLAKY